MHDQDENNPVEENPSFNDDKSFTLLPERHWFVTAWLILIIVINLAALIIYIMLPSKILAMSHTPYDTHLEILFLGALNIVFSLTLMRWRKIGFYGFCITAILSFLLNISTDISPIASILGLFGPALLYAILKIKKNGRPAWYYLK